ncbi:uncharacterized protein EV420DRAFT_1646413 [Desarmillaria tabescens]|uniref:Zn(2)-C6 fungal-type domain-containing protein n=1 Tax=Armillaria tabescens TaxID=1929756 RepID=A0AA39K1L0_ARMTA|nr:uncharacterized protein EV420DRAFT_1646413 [Desarmillaria tabescens]KAK0450493.1 hypothetical protein EV420DRAFT_1646413 [Desarmillaria tabescens]
MAPIRPHQKTRSGCKTCKQRKVKCDETLPICNNCTRRGVECVWGSTSPKQELATQEQSVVVAQSSSAEGSLAIWTLGEGSSDLLTLELMHHYSTAASYSLSADPDATTVWRGIIPQMAFEPQNQCLLQAILAFSALHIHYEDSTSHRHAQVATDYYNQAKFGIRVADTDGTADVNAVLVALCLVARYEFASSAAVFPIPGEWYNTIREIRRNLLKDRTELQDNVMHSLLAAIAPPHLPTSLTDQFPSALSTLLISAPDAEELHDASVRNAYQESIYFLEQAWRAPLNRCVGLWWYMMSNTFLQLLKEARPRALIILAHYCAMMKHITRDGPWWLKKKWGDEARRIVSMLDARWAPCLGWVLAQLDPERDSQVFDFTGMDTLSWGDAGDGRHF